MAKGFKHGGSNPLNFKVICNPQPSTAKENTIWVDTDRINNYYFSATQPENMVEYDVWFPTGTSSTVEFNALKKHGIQVYPTSAKQYIGGAWVDKTSKSWQGGAWVDWAIPISFLESEWTKINPYPAVTLYTDGTYTFSEDTFKGTVNGANKKCAICPKEKIDLTNVKNIVARWSLDTNLGGGGAFMIFVSPQPYHNDSSGTVVIVAKAETANVTDDVCTIPVSELEGSYYIGVSIATWENKGTVNATVSNMRLEQ